MDFNKAKGSSAHLEQHRPFSFTWKDGLRIIDLSELAKRMRCKRCSALLDLSRTEREARFGLASVLFVLCQCGFTNEVYTGKLQTTDDGSQMFEVNIKASINMLLCGTGARHVINFLAVLDIPLTPADDSSLVLPVSQNTTALPSQSILSSQETLTFDRMQIPDMSPASSHVQSGQHTACSSAKIYALALDNYMFSSRRENSHSKRPCRLKPSDKTVPEVQDFRKESNSDTQHGDSMEQNFPPHEAVRKNLENNKGVKSGTDDENEIHMRKDQSQIYETTRSSNVDEPEKSSLKACYKCPACLRVFSNSRGFLIHLSHAHKMFNEQVEDHILSATSSDFATSDAGPRAAPDPQSSASEPCPQQDSLSISPTSHQGETNATADGGRKPDSPVESSGDITLTVRNLSSAKQKSGKFSCGVKGCGRAFCSEQMYQQHMMKAHKTDGRYQCDVCLAVYTSESSLKRHITCDHTKAEMKVSICKYCKIIFDNPYRLKKHVSAEHPRGQKRTFSCELCPASYSRLSMLNTHLRTHSGEKPYKCFYCDMQFHKSGNRGLHVRFVHKNERSFLCDTCGASFHRACSLKDHERIHTGIKPFQCEICAESFTKKDYLNIHIRRHTGEKPYKCGECSAAYSQRISLSLHRRKVHGVPKQERIQPRYKKQ